MSSNMATKGLQYKSVEELNSQVKARVSYFQSADKVARSAPKVFLKAKESERTNLEEAYILYMRFIDIAVYIRKSPFYERDRKYYDSMLNMKDTSMAMQRAEALEIELSDLYRKNELKMKKAKEMEIQQKISERNDKIKANSPRPVETNGNLQDELALIDPTNILNLMNEKSTSFLIIDVRPSDDFKASHVQHPNVLSVPGESLKPGSTAIAIERLLSPETRVLWRKRLTVDKIIVMDWTSEKFPQDREESSLAVLKDALVKWETDNRKSKTLFLCRGGFENFGMQYPMHVSDPKFVKAPSENKKKPSLFALSDIKYPDLDTGLLSPSVSVTPSNTTLDTAGPLYPSTSEIAKTAILSGAITINGGSAPVLSRQQNPPSLPDRSTKPQPILKPTNIGFDDPNDDDGSTTGTANSSLNSVISELNNARLESDSSIDSERYAPAIDRSLKAKLILKGSNREIKDVIQAEKDLVEDTLQLDNAQLEMEKQWELFRLQRVKCAEKALRIEAQKQEDKLLLEIQRLCEEREAKDRENNELREQMRELKEKLKNSSLTRPQTEQIRNLELAKAVIEESERKTKAEVARKKEERIRKIKEEQMLTERKIEEAEKNRIETQRELEERKRILDLRDSTPVRKIPLKNGEEPKSNLNRSHSSPNIAQMDDDEDVIVTTRIPARDVIPVFNRTNKPTSLAEKSQARSRDFQPIWCSNAKGLTGLKNLGNTCYMNSILQCLSNIKLLATFFTENTYSPFINERSPTRGNIAIEFAEVVRKLWQDNIRSISPSDFKRTIGKHKDCFRGNEQQDAHELLVTLMEWLHNDVNEVKVKVKLPEQKNEGISPEEAALRAWESEQQADKSFIRELFYGQWRSSLTCKICSWESVKYESFFELSLPLPGGHNGRLSLEDCIETCLMPENVTYTCPRCKASRVCLKKFDIVKLPKVLTVQFVRFYNDGLWRKKQNFIDFKLDGMNFGKYATACGGKMNKHTNYNLFAVCNHFGSMEGGHYTAYCHSERHKKWFKYDDHEVSEMEPRDVVTPAAYVLFFSALNNR